MMNSDLREPHFYVCGMYGAVYAFTPSMLSKPEAKNEAKPPRLLTKDIFSSWRTGFPKAPFEAPQSLCRMKSIRMPEAGSDIPRSLLVFSPYQKRYDIRLAVGTSPQTLLSPLEMFRDGKEETPEAAASMSSIIRTDGRYLVGLTQWSWAMDAVAMGRLSGGAALGDSSLSSAGVLSADDAGNALVWKVNMDEWSRWSTFDADLEDEKAQGQVKPKPIGPLLQLTHRPGASRGLMFLPEWNEILVGGYHGAAGQKNQVGVISCYALEGKTSTSVPRDVVSSFKGDDAPGDAERPKDGRTFLSPVKTFVGHEKAIWDMALDTMNKKIFFTCGERSEARMWDHDTEKTCAVFKLDPDQYVCGRRCAYVADKTAFFVGTGAGKIRRFDPRKPGEIVWSIDRGGQFSNGIVRVSEDRMMSVSSGIIRMWKIESGKILARGKTTNHNFGVAGVGTPYDGEGMTIGIGVVDQMERFEYLASRTDGFTAVLTTKAVSLQSFLSLVAK